MEDINAIPVCVSVFVFVCAWLQYSEGAEQSFGLAAHVPALPASLHRPAFSQHMGR